MPREDKENQAWYEMTMFLAIISVSLYFSWRGDSSVHRRFSLGPTDNELEEVKVETEIYGNSLTQGCSSNDELLISLKSYQEMYMTLRGFFFRSLNRKNIKKSMKRISFPCTSPFELQPWVPNYNVLSLQITQMVSIAVIPEEV